MRIFANVILSIAVLAGQGASNLDLCLACAHVNFALDHDHDCHDENQDHGFAESDSQCGYCTQNDFAASQCSAVQFIALPLSTPQLTELAAFAVVEFPRPSLNLLPVRIRHADCFCFVAEIRIVNCPARS